VALFGKKAEITIAPERAVYVLGETVQAQVRVEAQKGLNVGRGVAELVASTRFEVRDRDGVGDDRNDVDETWHTDDVVVGQVVLLENATLTDGQVVEQPVSFVIDRSAPPSGEGSITTVRWELRVRLEVKGFDAKAAAPVTVLSPPSSALAEAPNHKADDCLMELSVRSRSVPAGGTVEGTVTVTPRAEMKAKRLRLRLERFEVVPARMGNSATEKVAQPVLAEDLGTMAADVSVSFPFAIPVPAQICPALTTRQSTVRWRLVAEVDRKLRKDEEVEIALNVYSAYHLAPDSGY
jgi:hypothetical protein